MSPWGVFSGAVATVLIAFFQFDINQVGMTIIGGIVLRAKHFIN